MQFYMLTLVKNIEQITVYLEIVQVLQHSLLKLHKINCRPHKSLQLLEYKTADIIKFIQYFTDFSIWNTKKGTRKTNHPTTEK